MQAAMEYEDLILDPDQSQGMGYQIQEGFPGWVQLLVQDKLASDTAVYNHGKLR